MDDEGAQNYRTSVKCKHMYDIHWSQYYILSRIRGLAWLIIVGSRFHDWIYWTPLLQLHWIKTAHKLNFLMKSVWEILTVVCLNLEESPVSRILDLWTLQYESESQSYITTDGQSASLSWNKAPIWGVTTRFLLLSNLCGFVDVGRSLLREDVSVVYHCCWSSSAQSFSGPSPLGLSKIRDFFFRRILRLAGLWWRYSTPPPHLQIHYVSFYNPVRIASRTHTWTVRLLWSAHPLPQ
jgi:hypothetical protein